MKLSAIIITRNEENNIINCIKTLGFADEVIVIDNDSTDQTVVKAKGQKAQVYSISGLDFSYLRNIGKEKSRSGWILYIDADERVTPQLAREIVGKINAEVHYHAYKLVRQNYFLGTLWPKQEHMVRLIKKESLIGWQGSLHETPHISGEIGKLSGLLLHYTHRDLSSMVVKTNEWSDIEAQLRFQNGHPQMKWWRFFRVMITAFWRSYITDEGWKVGIAGLIESIYQSFSTFITYAKLWEKQNNMQIKSNYKARQMDEE